MRAEPPLAGPALAGRQLTPESHTHVATYTLFVCGHTLFCARCHIHAFGAGACEAGVMNVASEACGVALGSAAGFAAGGVGYVLCIIVGSR